MNLIDWNNDTRFKKALSSNESTAIKKISADLQALVDAHHKGDTKAVVSYHEKIDNALHKLVGKEGLRPEEKDL